VEVKVRRRAVQEISVIRKLVNVSFIRTGLTEVFLLTTTKSIQTVSLRTVNARNYNSIHT